MMDRRSISHCMSILFLSLSLIALFNVCAAAESNNQKLISPKEYVIRYWDKHISKKCPKSPFLLSKASPLSASQAAHFKILAIQQSFSSELPTFCSQSSLFCPIIEYPDEVISEQEKGSPTKTTQADNSGSANNDGGMAFQNYNGSFSNYKINEDNNGTSFKNYSDETNFGFLYFKDYSKEGGSAAPSFSTYEGGKRSPASSFSSYGDGGGGGEAEDSVKPTSSTRKMNPQTKSGVIQGRFFRESELKQGNVMVMPDIQDKMPRRSFLPRLITSILPFSSSRINEIKQIFNVSDKSPMKWVIQNSLNECERASNRDETKKCVASIEDMIDFATSILGREIVVRNTQNINGSGKHVMIGKVKSVHGGMLTKSVSCHQNFYPYSLYYCHSVPEVKVYEVDILDPKSKKKINHGVALCHMNTSAWSPRHGAFAALGPGPGKIEVCHWIYQNDMIWTLCN